MKEITTTRLVLDKDEREIRKSWGYDWPKMVKDEKKHGHFTVLFGDWSGYRSSQYQITHVQYVTPKEAEEIKLRHIGFTDGTSMSIWMVKLTISDLLKKQYRKKLGYSSLIDKGIRSGKPSFNVADDNE